MQMTNYRYTVFRWNKRTNFVFLLRHHNIQVEIGLECVWVLFLDLRIAEEVLTHHRELGRQQ